MPTEDEPETRRDDRMYFIRLLESPDDREFSGEYEVASEARIAGRLEYNNADVIFQFLTPEKNRDGLYKYTLSVSAPAQYRLDRFETSPNGYHFAGGQHEEILSLAALFFRCRFFPVAYIFRDRTPGPPMHKIEHDFDYVRPQKATDPFIFTDPEENFVELAEFLDTVRRLPEDLHHGFANAVRLYALAIREVGVDDQLAYVHLVSAVEILAKDLELPEDSDPLQPIMGKLEEVLEGSSVEAKNELGNLLRQRKVKARFIKFITTYAGEHVEDRPEEGAKSNKVYKDDLPDALKRIYDGRSKFLHEGGSMYLSHPGMTAEGCDYDASVGQTIGNREFPESMKLPNIVFFEGLVRACLLKYLSSNIRNN